MPYIFILTRNAQSKVFVTLSRHAAGICCARGWRPRIMRVSFE